jgi:hypothetical protein
VLEIYRYSVSIEGHWVVAQITNVEPSHLYIDGEVRDTYNPDASNLWGPHNLLAPGLFELDWRTILRSFIIGADGRA